MHIRLCKMVRKVSCKLCNVVKPLPFFAAFLPLLHQYAVVCILLVFFSYCSRIQTTKQNPEFLFFGFLLLRGKVHSLTPQIHCGLPAAALLPFFLSGSAPLTLHSFTPFLLNTPYSYRAKFPLTRLSLLPTPRTSFQ